MGGVGRVAVESLLQVGDAALKPFDQCGDHRTGLIGEAVPDVLRDRSWPVHVAVIMRRP
jgi:hypothetical protein